MSYILDALKKAQAERQSGTPHALHAPPAFGGYERPRSIWRSRWQDTRLWGALAALAIAVVSAVWFIMAQREKPVAAPKPSEPSIPAVAQQMDAPRPATPPPPAPRLEDAAKPPAASEPKEPPKPVEKTAKKTVEKKRSAPPDASPAPRKETAVAAAEPSVPTLRELPPDIQREIPALNIGGYIYSGNSADRSVLINNRLLREGDEVAPGLRLEAMTPNGMVLNYKGYRYRAAYR